ncbi:hypothetical protein Q9L58_005179 [Maublancomyces gigas]|uniref:Uncharacterized protein n=1 Tax=Discina gigas TaxID=1032678 RepID=A0ABR3GJ06_9PEZI
MTPFSPSRPESEFGSGGGVYLEDQPEEDIEEAGDDNEDYFEGYDGIIPSARHQLEVANFTSEKLKLIIPEPKELEWWEIEGGDDGSCDEGSEDDEDDESDSEFDEDEDEDQESDYENGDDEREDDSDDDDSGEDSDLGESEDNNTILGIANPPSGPGALVPYPYQKPNSSTIIHTYAKGVGLVNLDAQDIEKGNDGPPTHPNVTDSDLGSCSSCTNVLPTPVIHSPLCILPVGNICLIGDKGLPGGRPHR